MYINTPSRNVSRHACENFLRKGIRLVSEYVKLCEYNFIGHIYMDALISESKKNEIPLFLELIDKQSLWKGYLKYRHSF